MPHTSLSAPERKPGGVQKKEDPTGDSAGAPIRSQPDNELLHLTPLTLWFAVFVPLAALFVEIVSGSMAGIYIDPIPSIWHALALLVVALSPPVVQWMISRAVHLRRPAHGLAFFINGFSLAVAVCYLLAFTPILPLSVLMIVALGSGLLGLAPLFCSISAVHLYRRLKQTTANPSELQPRRRLALAGGTTAAILAICLVGPGLVTPLLVDTALNADADPDSRSQAVWWLQRLPVDDALARECHPANRGLPPLFARDRVRSATSEQRRALYFRVTGQPLPAEQESARRSWKLFENSRQWQHDRNVGTSDTNGQIAGLSLGASVMQVRSAATTASQDPGTAYIEWTMEFVNTTAFQQEARTHIELPHGGVGSRLTLWINGEEREAAFGGRKQVKDAYAEVAVVQRRDPALLTSDGVGRLLLNCFPVPSSGRMKVKVGVTAPLVIRNGTATLRLPYLSGNNYRVPRSLRHLINFVGEPETNGRRVRSLRDDALRSPLRGSLSLPAPKVPSVVLGQMGKLRAEMELAWHRDVETQPKHLCLVIDGSRSMADRPFSWTQLVEWLPPATKVHVLHAGDSLSAWRSDFAEPNDDLAAWLDDQTFRGGCDPVPALLRAWELAAARSQAAVVWLHGPLPVMFSSAEPLRHMMQWMPEDKSNRQMRLQSLQLMPGPHQVLQQLSNSKAVEQVPIVGDVATTAAYFLAKGRSDDLARTYRLLADARSSTGETRQADVVRLAVFEEALLAGTSSDAARKEQARKDAIQARLVTPMTGAVVLEQADQYARHGLDPSANQESVAGVPEPEEWALILIVVALLGWIYWQKRRRAKPNLTAVA